MEEIKVGEYVRTPLGIAKYLGNYNGEAGWHEFDKLDEELWFDDIANVIYETQLDKIIKKHSSNLIDLIEKDDYVNGERVLVVNDIITDGGEKAILVENYDEWTDDGVITNKDIKSIVTHEQFAQIEYKVEE